MVSEFLRAVTRRRVNERLGQKDLNEWILALVNLEGQERILDVACGDGKQLMAYAKCLDKTVTAVGLDISSEALQELEKEAARFRWPVRLVAGPMEDILSLLPERKYYDLVSCCYGLYYSHLPAKTLHDFKELLKADGRLIIVGPDHNNNSELYTLLKSFKPLPNKVETVNRFMREVAIPECSKLFVELRCSFFENPVVFPTVESLLEYWRSTDVFNPEIEDDLAEVLLQDFQAKGNFTITKRAIGVLAYQPTP